MPVHAPGLAPHFRILFASRRVRPSYSGSYSTQRYSALEGRLLRSIAPTQARLGMLVVGDQLFMFLSCQRMQPIVHLKRACT